jgi:hypothetical protein
VIMGGHLQHDGVANLELEMPRLQGHRLALKRSRRPQRDSEQGRAEEKDQRRAAESTNRPDRISKGAAFATESERKLAGAKRERRQCRDGDASADSHGESCRHASPEDPLRQREDEHEDRPRAWPDADREHHRKNLSP